MRSKYRPILDKTREWKFGIFLCTVYCRICKANGVALVVNGKRIYTIRGIRELNNVGPD